MKMITSQSESTGTNSPATPSRSHSAATELVAAFDTRVQFDVETERLIASVKGAVLRKARLEFQSQMDELEVESIIHDVHESIRVSAKPPVFASSGRAFGYMWLSVRRRIHSALSPRNGVDRNSVSIDASADDRSRSLSDTLPAHGFGSAIADEWIDMQRAIETNRFAEARARRAVFVRALIAGWGYSVAELLNFDFIAKELNDARVRDDIAARLGRSALAIIPEFLSMIATITSAGAIGNDSTAGKKLLASLCDRTPAADVKRPRN